MIGGNASRTLNGSLAGLPMETTFGIQTRYDDIDLALTDTFQRSFLSNVRSDKVGEGSVGVYAQNTVHWTDWLRTTLGWRGDYYDANVNSIFDANNSGHVSAGIGSPKFTMVLGPFNKTEFFVGAGTGMHSNDARGATITEDPDRSRHQAVRLAASGAHQGRRGRRAHQDRCRASIPRSACSCSTRIPRSSSSGDAGDTAASRPSRRYGVELTNHYRPSSWIDIDADLAMTHARFVGFDSDAGRRLRLARRLPAGADRQRARQLHSQRARDGGLGRHHARREDRLVRHVALALSRRDAR